MCGIAGIHAPGGTADSELVRAMTARLVHRGPDGDGYHSDGEIALGMRRLAIIDPEHGHQPLLNESGDVVAVFNGEIYNHAELRRELEGRGHGMRSASDGEIVPHLYEEHGPDFARRLNGIFAIAIWDRRSRSLHLMRDKFGVKPLYWSRAGGRLAFASEIKALLADDSLPRDLDLEALDQFLTFRFVPSPRTLFQSVRKLPPASLLSSTQDGIEERRYWTSEPSASRRDTTALIDEYGQAFERAVARQLMSDRPLGVMLSGGVDSAAVTAVAAKHTPELRTFTVGFSGGGEGTNEIPPAAETARLFGARHEHVVITADEYLEGLPGSLLTLEEPGGTTSALAVRFVAELMKPSVPVALSGQGADEPLAGYGRHLGVKLATGLRALGPLRKPLSKLAGRTGNEQLRRGLTALDSRGDAELLLSAYTIFGEDEKRRLYRGRMREWLGAGDELDVVERYRAPVSTLPPLAQMLYVDTRLTLPDELLLIADKMSMAESVELRVPFLDEDLVALVESMHPSLKLRGRTGKWIHKQAMKRLLPEEIVNRPKLGWETPLDRWLRSELRPLLEEVLLGEGELCRELFEERELRRLIELHASGERDLTKRLFLLLSLGLWHRGFVAQGAPAAVR
ncbi:MAG TPA: asparagine synthase (glutamine-hydrolyzing) [Thermoleophilaceae bacterium]|nr:asparagine synthase (glutamine-hydrolyzing) [Thermoleophilaceae bacterium]